MMGHRTSVSRRGFLGLAAAALAAPALAGRLGAQSQGPLAGEGDIGTLRDPAAAGRSRAPTSAKDNDAEIKAIEHQLQCTCGCTLDIYTCRTTDFTCTYSPELHREIVALHDQGLTAQEIIDTFVAKYGEKALMAPKPEGFNLAGYLVPGAVIATAGGLLAWVLRRRTRLAEERAEAAAGPAAELPALDATPEELERLRRALAEVED